MLWRNYFHNSKLMMNQIGKHSFQVNFLFFFFFTNTFNIKLTISLLILHPHIEKKTVNIKLVSLFRSITKQTKKRAKTLNMNSNSKINL